MRKSGRKSNRRDVGSHRRETCRHDNKKSRAIGLTPRFVIVMKYAAGHNPMLHDWCDISCISFPYPFPPLPLTSIHLFLFRLPSHTLSLGFFFSLSLRALVLSVSDTQWIREYLAAHYQTSLHLPLPLCAQAYQSESHCQHWHHRSAASAAL